MKNKKRAFVMVIFGATGDLAHHKLIPALFSLFNREKLPDNFSVIGFSRREMTNRQFRGHFENLKDRKGWSKFSKMLIYQKGDFQDKDAYLELIEKLEELDKKYKGQVTRLFYLATPPQNYDTILDFMEDTKLSRGIGQDSINQTKIIIEKPFGKDLETAKSLDKKLYKTFKEEQIFRVDHYLGKETIQNMLAFRFANGIFEPVWNNRFIDHVQITFAEQKGIEGRGRFFDGVGILRDVAQNHLMQILASVAMEQPKSFEREAIRDARAKVIEAIRPIEPKDTGKFTVRGQYEGYLSEKDIDRNSNTGTYTAVKLFVDTERFQGVPFYLRAGKNMPKNTVYVSVVFIQTCHILFKEYGCPEIGNVLTIKIQPDEGITLRVIAKKPQEKLDLATVNMKFTYKDEFGVEIKDAYEKILLDIFAGDQMLFNRSDELQSSWKFITKILKGWEVQIKSSKWKMPKYKKGTWGPKEALDLLEKDGRKWIEA